ncbi:ATP-binding protein [Aliidongia dinghuensis]|nr:hypothetical protein [Aliidongia dinghuensis]
MEAIASAAADTSAKLGNADVNFRNDAARLTELATALTKGGYPEAARGVVHRAAALFADGGNGIGPLWRGPVIEDLVRLGEHREAASLADVELQPQLKAILLGRLGVALAGAGDVGGAEEVLSRVQELPAAKDKGFLSQSSSTALALADVAGALAMSGQMQASIDLAEGFPDGLPKVMILSEAATAWCASGPGGTRDLRRGTELARRTADLALALLRTGSQASDRRWLAASAAEAFAECQGAEAARSFVRDPAIPTLPFDVLNATVDKLIDRGDVALARSLVPQDDTLTLDEWLAEERRLEKLGDRPAAIDAARKASEIAARSDAPPAGPSQRSRLHLVGRQAIGVLVELGAYDDAVQEMSTLGPRDREEVLLDIVADAAKRKDATAVQRFASLATGAAGAAEDAGASALARLAKTLAFAGYQPEATRAFSAWQRIWASPRREPPPDQAIELEAVMGDFAAAMAKTRSMGELVEERRDPAIAAAEERLRTAPDPQSKAKWEQFLADPRRAAKRSPVRVPSIRARTLGSIAVDMAALSGTSDAIRAEAELETDPDTCLAALRDQAFVAISAAQARSGGFQGALETALRVSDLDTRWQALLAAVTIAGGSQ